jgi:dTDP-4-dehydrorhamnose 3,5-epimerase
MISVIDTKFSDAKLYVPDVYEDDRGFFKETFSRDKYSAAGLDVDFVQDSVSWSTRNVVRGLHYDMRMIKFVQCLRGRVFDVIVDMREGSPTYRKWQGFMLTESNHHQLFVPAGFAHGFLALADDVIFTYKQSAHYDPAHERAVNWRDPAIGVEWPLAGEARVSPKDQAVPFL